MLTYYVDILLTICLKKVKIRIIKSLSVFIFFFINHKYISFFMANQTILNNLLISF